MNGSPNSRRATDLALPPEAVDYLDRLRELGVPERAIEMERDAWILVAAQIPDQMPALMAIKRAQIEDPAVIGDLPGPRRCRRLGCRTIHGSR